MSYKDKIKYNKYMKEYMIRRYRDRKEYAIQLLGGKCNICGSKNNLEIDHIHREDKKINFAKKIHTIPYDDFIKELNVCQILCNKCHLIKTSRELSNDYCGSNNPNAKLTDEIVAEILSVYKNRTIKSLSIEYNISRSTIYSIIKGKTWKHVDR